MFRWPSRLLLTQTNVADVCRDVCYISLRSQQQHISAGLLDRWLAASPSSPFNILRSHHFGQSRSTQLRPACCSNYSHHSSHCFIDLTMVLFDFYYCFITPRRRRRQRESVSSFSLLPLSPPLSLLRLSFVFRLVSGTKIDRRSCTYVFMSTSM